MSENCIITANACAVLVAPRSNAREILDAALADLERPTREVTPLVDELRRVAPQTNWQWFNATADAAEVAACAAVARHLLAEDRALRDALGRNRACLSCEPLPGLEVLVLAEDLDFDEAALTRLIHRQVMALRMRDETAEAIPAA